MDGWIDGSMNTWMDTDCFMDRLIDGWIAIYN
jgi:hypothetical protein